MAHCSPFMRCANQRATKRWLRFVMILVNFMFLPTAFAMDSSPEKGMFRLIITIDNQTLHATLTDSATTRDFVAQLPLTLLLEDYAATEKIATLPSRLTRKGAPSGMVPNKGDIAFYVPWGNIALFYQDFSYSHGLIKLGEITHGLELLHFSGAKQAKFELNSPLNTNA